MSVATQVTDLTDLRTDLINRVRDATGVTATNNLADRYVNTALMDMHINPITVPYWAIRRDVLITHAPYSTGTVSIAAATRTTVTGSSTAWNTAVTGFGFNNARVGGKMKFSGLNEIYEVSAIGSDTSITLLTRYTGDALSVATYTYFEDEYALATDFLRPADLRMFSTDLKIPLIGAMQFRRYYPRNDISGKPRVATFIQLSFSGNTTPRPRIVLHPYPDDEYSVPYHYVTSYLAVTSGGTEQTQLTNTTDEPIVPLRYRHAIVFHALYHWYRDRKDDARSQEAKAEYVDIMTRISGDTVIGQDRPKLVAMTRFGRRRKRGSQRYSINSDFDEIRDR